MTADECNEEEYKCSDGKCIDEDLVCDVNHDCEDGLDEQDCAVLSGTVVTVPLSCMCKFIQQVKLILCGCSTDDNVYYHSPLCQQTCKSGSHSCKSHHQCKWGCSTDSSRS